MRVAVLEVFPSSVRAGFAGEPKPRCVWPLDEIGALFTDGLLVTKMPQLGILLLERPTAPRSQRQAFVDAVVAAGPASVAFAPSTVAAALALGTKTALLVDVGAESIVVAVCDGFALEHTLCAASTPDLFDDVDGVPALVLRCLAKCSLETRPRLAAVIAPIGATTDDFDQKLCDDLRRLGPRYDYATFRAAFPRDQLSWLGGSVLAEAALRDGRFDGVRPDDIRAAGPPDIFALPSSSIFTGIRPQCPTPLSGRRHHFPLPSPRRR